MKKQLFVVALAALAMASCSKEESTGVNTGNAIDFRAAMGTLASETTTANLSKFYVTALKGSVNYFTNVEFTKDGSSFFVSSPAYYWPSDDSSLSFYAYSPSATDLGATVTINNTTKTLVDFKPASTLGAQKDFVTANASGNKTANESAGVALTFNHQLAQIEIKAKNGNTGYVYKVQGVRIGKPVSKATFDFGTSAWSLSTDKANYVSEYTTPITLNATAASIMSSSDGNAMLIPQQLVAWDSSSDKTNSANGAYLAVKVNIATSAGAQVYPKTDGAYDWVAVPIDTEWIAGNKYVYTLDFSNGAGQVDPEKPTPTDPTDPKPGDDVMGSPIKFTVAVTDWVEAPQNVTM